VSHGFTLIVTDDTTCPGIEISKLGGSLPGSIGGYLRAIPAVRDWIAKEQRAADDCLYVLGDKDPIPEHLARRSLTFPVEDSVYRRYEQARATA
jgi:hypothetical protein